MTFSLGKFVAGVAWALSAALLGVAWWLDLPHLGTVAVAAAMVAMTATVRTYFVTTNSMLKNAFELGRETSRVRSMR